MSEYEPRAPMGKEKMRNETDRKNNVRRFFARIYARYPDGALWVCDNCGSLHGSRT